MADASDTGPQIDLEYTYTLICSRCGSRIAAGTRCWCEGPPDPVGVIVTSGSSYMDPVPEG